MTMHIYVCDHCKHPIDRHAQTRLVTDEFGLHFYHVSPDCFEAHKLQRARAAFANAISLQRDFDYMPDDQWFLKNAPKYHNREGNGG